MDLMFSQVRPAPVSLFLSALSVVERARCYVDEIYAQMKAYGGPLGKDKVLVMMLISLADDFLQLREQHSRADGRLDELLQSLKESGMGSEGDEMPPEGK